MLISRAQNARLQMLRAELMKLPGFGDEDYRNILYEAAGVRSSKDLPPARYTAAMDALAGTLTAALGIKGGFVDGGAYKGPIPWAVDTAEEIAGRRRRRPRLAAVDGEAIRYASPGTISALFGKGSYLFGRLHEGVRTSITPGRWVKDEVRRLTGKEIDDLTEADADRVMASFRSRIGHIVSPRGRKAAR